MVETLTIVYLVYMFIAVYFLTLHALTFLQNKKEIFGYHPIKKNRTVSLLIPAYNEESSIRETVEAVLNIDYDNLIEVIVINDGSTDNTGKIARELEKEFQKVKLFDKPNSGKADSLNQAVKIANGELIAIVDADSFPSRDSFNKMLGYFDDEDDVGCVTTRILVRNPRNMVQRLQSIEYKVIAFSRKIFDFLDAVYVAPGPLVIYRKSSLQKIGGFDVKNMTEDIEATWHLSFENYKVRMSFLPSVKTVSPDTWRKWIKQRVRWNIGGIQTVLKYKKHFLRKGMLGYFILPFFTTSFLLGIVGLSIFAYRVSSRFLISYLSTIYSINSQTALLRIQDINLNPTILHFFGIVVFVLGLLFLFFSLYMANLKTKSEESIFSIIFYSIVYMTLYPLVLLFSFYKFTRGKYSWR